MFIVFVKLVSRLIYKTDGFNSKTYQINLVRCINGFINIISISSVYSFGNNYLFCLNVHKIWLFVIIQIFLLIKKYKNNKVVCWFVSNKR